MKKNIIINIIFKIIIIVLLLISIFINDNYKLINNKNIINNKETYEQYKSNKFVTIDLTKATVTRLNVIKDDEYNTYILTYNDIDILIELTRGTVLTEKVNVMYLNDTIAELDLKATFNEEENTNFVKGYYTNKNIKTNENIINYSIWATYGFISLLFIFIIIDIVKLIKNKNNTI